MKCIYRIWKVKGPGGCGVQVAHGMHDTILRSATRGFFFFFSNCDSVCVFFGWARGPQAILIRNDDKWQCY
jgi:hypothetical protein